MESGSEEDAAWTAAHQAGIAAEAAAAATVFPPLPLVVTTPVPSVPVVHTGISETDRTAFVDQFCGIQLYLLEVGLSGALLAQPSLRVMRSHCWTRSCLSAVYRIWEPCRRGSSSRA